MKGITIFLILIVSFSCGKSRKNSSEVILSPQKQDSIFTNLITITNNTIPKNRQNDSLAFLVLPIQASCPSCRRKTIDSIVKHKDNLRPDHFIIISAKMGRKTISSFFKEQKHELPAIQGQLFLDSTNQAFQYDLYDTKPTIYYTFKQKAYKKVAAIPATVRDDLSEFFSGPKK